LGHPSARVAFLVPVRTHRVIHLRSDYEFIATTGDCFADYLFAFASGVRVGSVDEVDTRIKGFVNDAYAFGVIGIAHLAEHHCAEAVAAD
jgi:hypothetical protein